jgi:hypothetical protein
VIINPENISNANYQIIICGSGPAGMSIAIDLEKNKINCLILEAGDSEYSEKAQNRYNGKVIGQYPDNLSISRLSQFGGTSNHWGGGCRTLDEYDYIKWPIKKKDLNPYLDGACKFLKIKNNFRDEELNNSFKSVEFQNSNLNIYNDYFEYVKKSKYINLALNTSIYNVKFLDNAINEIIIKSEKNSYTIKNKILVLACGGIENSRLLLWFRHLNPGYFKDLPIGNYWMEHPYKEVGTGIVDNEEVKKFIGGVNKFNIPSGSNNRSWLAMISPTNNLIKEQKILNAIIYIDIYERDNSNYKNILKNLLCTAPKIADTISKFKGVSCGFSIASSWEQEAIYENYISLSSNEYDDLGVKRVNLNYSISDLTLFTMKKIIEELGNTFINKKIGRVAGFDYLWDKKKFISNAGYHHLGGTRMGLDLKESVVDKNLKVHNVKNLFVAGSSVFPTGGAANPTLSIVQLSLKLSKFLIEKII